MTLYERCCRLELDLARIGLERGDSRGSYFCDPVGAEAIGWAGVDGIHFCFVEGFGETVFAVSPANGPGDYVHPLARSFEDFLRLVLACGGVDALEQAWMWNRGEFDAYLETYPPSVGPKRRAKRSSRPRSSGPCWTGSGRRWGSRPWTTPTGISRGCSPALITAR